MSSWNFLVYMAADNDLDGQAPVDLEEMSAVGSSDRVRICAQVDRSADPFRLSSEPVPNQTRRYEVGPHTSGGLQEVLATYVQWATLGRPAARTALVLWNHGTGIWNDPSYVKKMRDAKIPSPVRLARATRRTPFARTRRLAALRGRDILRDDGAQDSLDNEELRSAVRHIKLLLGQPLDLLGADACLMAMVESACIVRDYVRVVVGSQDEEPATGWPYDHILQDLVATPELQPEALAAAIVRRYVDSARGRSITLSAIAPDRLDPLLDAIRALRNALLDNEEELEDRMFELARSRARAVSFFSGDYVDIVDFVNTLYDRSDSTRVRAACELVRGALAAPDGPVLCNATRGIYADRCCGLSICVPRSLSGFEDYDQLAFHERTGWGDVLRALAGGDQS